jgi:hypothetical protein
LFAILYLGHWYLFGPALARIGLRRALYVSISQVERVSMAGLHAVWARDLVFGAWNFRDYQQQAYLRKTGQLLI